MWRPIVFCLVTEETEAQRKLGKAQCYKFDDLDLRAHGSQAWC